MRATIRVTNDRIADWKLSIEGERSEGGGFKFEIVDSKSSGGNHRLNFKFNPPTPASETFKRNTGARIPTFVRRNFNFKTGKPLPLLPFPPRSPCTRFPSVKFCDAQFKHSQCKTRKILWQRRSLNVHWPARDRRFRVAPQKFPVTLQQRSVYGSGRLSSGFYSVKPVAAYFAVREISA